MGQYRLVKVREAVLASGTVEGSIVCGGNRA